MGVRSQPRPYVHSNFEWTVRTSETSCPGVFGRRGPPGVGEVSIHRPPLAVAECSRAVETLLLVPLCRAQLHALPGCHAMALLCAAASLHSAVCRARGFCCSCNSGSRPCFAVGVLWALPLQLELEAVAVRPEGTVSGKAAPLWAWSQPRPAVPLQNGRSLNETSQRMAWQTGFLSGPVWLAE